VRGSLEFPLLGYKGAPSPLDFLRYRSSHSFSKESGDPFELSGVWDGVVASHTQPARMPRPTNKPPAAEWERLKEVILSLAVKHSWRDVVEKMEREHNFVAM
jgi:hypothetical protein